MELHRSRTTEEARAALSAFCKAVGTHGDKRVHIFTVPVDEERDVDCILSDVITERDLLRAILEKFVDNDGCLLDPEGGCKSHMQKTGRYEKPCVVREARELLKRREKP